LEKVLLIRRNLYGQEEKVNSLFIGHIIQHFFEIIKSLQGGIRLHGGFVLSSSDNPTFSFYASEG
jgi:prolipoprotein diacylglyceryltransferase